MNRSYTDDPHRKMTAPTPSALPTGGASHTMSNPKDSGFPGVPGPTQPKKRSNGSHTTGPLGPFHVKSEGI